MTSPLDRLWEQADAKAKAKEYVGRHRRDELAPNRPGRPSPRHAAKDRQP